MDHNKQANFVSRSIQEYQNLIGSALLETTIRDECGNAVGQDEGIERACLALRGAAAEGQIFFIGNGGSAAIAEHMAADFSAHGFRGRSLSAGPALTAIGNDLEFEQIFSKQLALHARAFDALVAISSSGESPNIIRAVNIFQSVSGEVITFSGMKRNNRLHSLGKVNFHVATSEYGLTEVCHHALCHYLLDTIFGPSTRNPSENE